MSDTAVVSPTTEPTAATSSQTPADTSVTAEPQGSQAAGAAPSEETFFSGDPNSLPPELKQAYTNMLKDYKSKTQSIAETRKKADNYDKISKDQRFVDYWNNLNRSQKADFKEQKEAVEKRLGEKITDEEFQKSFESKDAYLSMQERIAQHVMEKAQKEIGELKQFKLVTEAQNTVDAYATELDPQGKQLRPDFYSLDEDKLITGYLSVNTPRDNSVEAYRERLNEAYDWAKTLSHKYYEKGKAEALQVIQKKVGTSTEPPTNAAKGAYSGPDPKKLTVREAFEMAKRGERVPRND